MIGQNVEFFVESNVHGRTMNYVDVKPFSRPFSEINGILKGIVKSVDGSKLVVDYV